MFRVNWLDFKVFLVLVVVSGLSAVNCTQSTANYFFHSIYSMFNPILLTFLIFFFHFSFLSFYVFNANPQRNHLSSEHFNYQKHKCTSAHKKDIQVPACPLCGEPVPTPRGVSPDMTVGQHLDLMCKSDKTKIFTNRCTVKGCKKKELIPVQCSHCKMNYCLRHRHAADHDCNPNAARSGLLA